MSNEFKFTDDLLFLHEMLSGEGDFSNDSWINDDESSSLLESHELAPDLLESLTVRKPKMDDIIFSEAINVYDCLNLDPNLPLHEFSDSFWLQLSQFQKLVLRQLVNDILVWHQTERGNTECYPCSDVTWIDMACAVKSIMLKSDKEIYMAQRNWSICLPLQFGSSTANAISHFKSIALIRNVTIKGINTLSRIRSAQINHFEMSQHMMEVDVAFSELYMIDRESCSLISSPSSSSSSSS